MSRATMDENAVKSLKQRTLFSWFLAGFYLLILLSGCCGLGGGITLASYSPEKDAFFSFMIGAFFSFVVVFGAGSLFLILCLQACSPEDREYVNRAVLYY